MKQVKNVKKSMFISTLLIVVLLIAAIATATYAWFTAQTTVTADGTIVTSATSDSASLGIGWNEDVALLNDGSNFSLVFGVPVVENSANNAIRPMAPKINPVGNAILADTTLVDFLFHQETVRHCDDGTLILCGLSACNAALPCRLLTCQDPVLVFNGDGSPADAARFASPAFAGSSAYGLRNAGHFETFVLGNTAALNGTAIDQIQISIPTNGIEAENDDNGDISALLRAAVFVRLGTAEGEVAATGNFIYVGTLASANDARTVAGDIKEDGDTRDMKWYNAGTTVNLLGSAQTLQAGFVMEVVILAWFDGDGLVNTNAGGSVAMDLRFQAFVG